MANTIILKRSSTASDVPTAGQLEQGELAINIADEKLYSKNSSNAVFEIAPGGSIWSQNGTFADYLTGDVAGGIRIGRNGNENFEIEVTDSDVFFRYDQDETSGVSHQVIFDIETTTTDDHGYRWRDNGAEVMELDLRFQRLSLWNAYDLFLYNSGNSNYLSIDQGGATMLTGANWTITNFKPVFAASSTARASINLPEGTAPTTPIDGDMWVTTTDAFVRVNGVSQSIISGGGITDIVQDTTPQLGGDLQSNAFDIDMADNDQITFGTSADAQMFFDATRLVIDVGTPDKLYIRGDQNSQISLHLTNTGSTAELASFGFFGSTTLDIRNEQNSGVINITGKDSGGADSIICQGDPDGFFYAYYDGISQFRTQSYNAAGNSTGAQVKAHNNTWYDVGLNVMPVYEIDANDTFDVDHASMIWHKDANAAVTFTCPDSTDMPNGTMWVVHNDDTEDLTIGGHGVGSVTVEWLEAGAAPVAGNVTVKQGGLVTVYKYSQTAYWVWGAKDSVSGGIANVVEDTTPQLGGDLDTNNFDILVGDGDFIKFGAGNDFTISHDGASNDLDINSAAGGSEIHLLNNMHLFFHGGAKTADFQYDGTDFAIFMSSADPFQLHGASQLDLRDGCDLLIRNSADTDYVTFAHNGTDFTMTGTNTANLNIVGMGLHLADNIDLHFGTGEDVDMYFNATDFYTDLIAGADWRLRLNATENCIVAEYNSGAPYVSLYYNNGIQFRTQNRTTGVTSGCEIVSHDGAWKDVGFNTLDVETEDVSDTLEAKHCGGVIFKDGTTAITVTCESSGSTDFPIGGVTTIINAGTSGNITVADGSQILYYLDGSSRTDVGANCTIAPGGVATLWRENTNIYYIWGSGITP